MNNISDLSRYYVNQIRSISHSTTNWVFGLLFVLVLIWRGTLHEMQGKIKEAITEKKRAENLKRLSNRIKLEADTLSVSDTQYFAGKPKSMALTYQSEREKARDNFYRKIRGKRALQSVIQQQTAKALQKFANIKDSILVEYDIPTLKPVKEKSRIGTMAWLFLLDLALLLLVLARNKIFSYLRRLLHSLEQDQTPPDDAYKLDLHVPFWLYPFSNKEIKGAETSYIRSLLPEEKRYQNYFWLALCLLPLTYLQIHTFLINWNLNVLIFSDDYSTFSKLLALFFLAFFFCLLLYWLFFSNRIVPEQVPSAMPKTKKWNRRRFLKMAGMSIPGLLLLVAIPAIGRNVPLMEPGETQRRRRRKHCMSENPLKNKQSGFYLNQKKVIHYVSPEKICLSLKTVTPDTKGSFLGSLRKPLLPSMLVKKKGKLHIPFAPIVLSNAFNHMVSSNKKDEAAATVLMGLKYFRQNKMQNPGSFISLVKDFGAADKGPYGNEIRRELASFIKPSSGTQSTIIR